MYGSEKILASNVKRDYYEILGVTREVTEVELKSAYRKLAMQYHPDRNPNNPEAEEKFKECSEAYAILADGDKRAAYDRFGHAGIGGSGAGGFDPSNFQDLSDIFGDFFGFSDLFGGGGRGGRRSRAQRGADLREDINLEFEEAVLIPNRPSPSVATKPVKIATDQARLRAKLQLHVVPATVRGKSAITGILQHRAHLPHLPGNRPGHHRSLCKVQRRRPCATPEEY